MGPFARLFRRSADDIIPTFDVATTVGKDVEVRGDVRGPGGVRIEGVVTGSVETDGPVVVGEGGTVDGSVRGSVVVVLGRVRGDVRTGGHLEIGPRGKVVGDVTVESLRVHKGGVFRGTSRMSGADDLTPTSPFGILATAGAAPRGILAEVDPDAAVRGRTLPPPGGAVPPPATASGSSAASHASPVPPAVESEERLVSNVVARLAPPLPERPRAANEDD